MIVINILTKVFKPSSTGKEKINEFREALFGNDIKTIDMYYIHIIDDEELIIEATRGLGCDQFSYNLVKRNLSDNDLIKTSISEKFAHHMIQTSEFRIPARTNVPLKIERVFLGSYDLPEKSRHGHHIETLHYLDTYINPYPIQDKSTQVMSVDFVAHSDHVLFDSWESEDIHVPDWFGEEIVTHKEEERRLWRVYNGLEFYQTL